MAYIACAGISILCSAITTKILATHYFEIVDSYVKEMCDVTKKFYDEIKDSHNNG